MTALCRARTKWVTIWEDGVCPRPLQNLCVSMTYVPSFTGETLKNTIYIVDATVGTSVLRKGLGLRLLRIKVVGQCIKVGGNICNFCLGYGIC